MRRGVLPFIAFQVPTLLRIVMFPKLATWLPEKLVQ
jgi:TRAP-type mannitol/chloroaromatic compound transport system permease large subunit